MQYKKIGIICAMESEAEEILSALENKKEEKIGSLKFSLGTCGEKKLVVAVCGIGKVFAALCAQTLILNYAPDCLICSGVAGSLSEKLEILDVALGESLVQHDMDTSPLGDPVGLISGINKVFLPCDPDLSASIKKAAKDLKINVLEGVIATGDQFVATKEQKEKIRSAFGAIACEMEGGAIAQTAFVNGVPFACIRAISDSYLGKNEMDYAKFAPAAAKRGAQLLLSAIKN